MTNHTPTMQDLLDADASRDVYAASEVLAQITGDERRSIRAARILIQGGATVDTTRTLADIAAAIDQGTAAIIIDEAIMAGAAPGLARDFGYLLEETRSTKIGDDQVWEIRDAYEAETGEDCWIEVEELSPETIADIAQAVGMGYDIAGMLEEAAYDLEDDA